jgi:hypothetical protein
VKLTSTNSSIGLIVLIARAHQLMRIDKVFKIKGLAIRQLLNQLAHAAHVQMLRFADLVVMAGRLHPFPFRTRP